MWRETKMKPNTSNNDEHPTYTKSSLAKRIMEQQEVINNLVISKDKAFEQGYAKALDDVRGLVSNFVYNWNIDKFDGERQEYHLKGRDIREVENEIAKLVKENK